MVTNNTSVSNVKNAKTLIEQQNEFLQRWKISELKIDHILEVKQFKERILRFFGNNTFYTYKDDRNYVVKCSIGLDVKKLAIYYPQISGTYPYELIYNLLNNETNLLDILFKLKFIVNQIIYFSYDGWNSETFMIPFFFSKHESIIDDFKKCFEISSINADVIFIKNSVSYIVDFFPRGDKILDTTLVEDVLPLLEDNSKKQYLDALNCYLNKDYENSANHLRKTLESWLRSVFQIEKSLDNIVKPPFYAHCKIDKLAPYFSLYFIGVSPPKLS